MNAQTYLICHLQHLQYAIPTDFVREVFPLPELQTLPETPSDCLGTLDLHGTLIPVLHLGQRIGRLAPVCTATDTVVTIATDSQQAGLVVDRASDVVNIPIESIEKDLSFGRQGHSNPAFLSGIINLDGQNVMVLNPTALLSLADEVANWVWAADNNSTDSAISSLAETETAPPPEIVANFYDRYFPTATAAQRLLLQSRAQELRSVQQDSNASQKIPLAVFGLAGEYFGLALSSVREFIVVQDIQPLPCTPLRIIGNTNLRGEIVTMVDLRLALNLPSRKEPHRQAVVAQIGEVVAGISIDELHDILYLDATALDPVPVANKTGRGSYLQSTTPYRDRVLNVLDLPKILEIA
jgi:purine-binding chemotaxis protein CheW